MKKHNNRRRHLRNNPLSNRNLHSNYNFRRRHSKFNRLRRKFRRLHLSLKGAILTFVCFFIIYSPVFIRLRNNLLGMNFAYGFELILFVLMLMGVYLIFIGYWNR